MELSTAPEKPKTKPDAMSGHFIDITSLICPMTFVRTKLMLEKLENGEVLRVKLKGREPLLNVPRSLREHGHEVLSVDREDPNGPEDGVHELLVRKSAG